MSDFPPELEPPRTKYEEILYKMGKLRADMKRAQRRLNDEDVSGEFAAQLGFISGDLNAFIRSVIEYIEEGEEMPDSCPVCGEEVREVAELEPGQSYETDRMCIEETTPGGAGRGIIHFTEETDAE